MNKHTPGPWKAHFDEAYFVTGPDLGRVAMTMNLKAAYGMGGRRSGNESAANCRLIAAAPDLLALLQELIDIEGPQPGTAAWADKARAAIAKATGEAP